MGLKKRLSRRTIDHLFKKYANKIGIDNITPHSTRITFITKALENNSPIEAVQKTVGNAQIKITQMYDKHTAKSLDGVGRFISIQFR